MKQAIGMLLWMLPAIAAASVHETAAAKYALEHGVIRLHILANSDSTADQTDKLLVRDAVLSHASAWIPQNADYESGCAALKEAIPAVQRIAEQTLRDAGCKDPVTVTFGETAFPARSYGACTLPAGNYQALQVRIGEAAGQNWWCVMYPSLCIPAAAETEPSALFQDALPEDARSLTAHPEEFELRLKCADVCMAAVSRLRALTQTETPASPGGEAGGDPNGALSSRSRYCSHYCSRSHCRIRSRRTAESE